jgi:tRNA(Ile)-lysidine synthase
MGAGKFKAGKTGFVEWFDWEKIKPPLIVRMRKDGDRFIPLGLVEEKKVGRFLIDQRVPQRIRKKVLVVADSEKIIWLWPIRMCGQAKITEKTKKILRLQITDAGSK